MLFRSSGFSVLYGISFRYPLFAIGIGYGICVLIGGLLIRRAERKNRLLYTPRGEEPLEEVIVAAQPQS